MSIEMAYDGPVARDIFLFGAPGAEVSNETGELELSEAGIACTGLAAAYWQAHQPETERIISLAGYAGSRTGMAAPPEGQTEAGLSNALLIESGIPAEAIVPPTGHDKRYAHSTIDEICLAMEYGITDPRRYTSDSPLGVVISTPGHGRRALDAFDKVGFDKNSIRIMAASPETPPIERAARVLYGIFVVSGSAVIEPAKLQKREERLMRILRG
jgi:hypothetical protein